MTMAATAGGPYKVPRRHDGWRSFALAVAMHALLFVFLWGGIRWQNTQPTAVEAEVWDLSTQQAAPPQPQPEPQQEPEPTPAPPPPTPAAPPEKVAPPKADPEIALRKEREKKEKERQQLAEEKRKQEAADRKLIEQKEKEEQKRRDEALAEQKKLDEAKKKKEKELAAKAAAAAEAKAKKEREDNIRRMTAGLGTAGTAEKSTAPRIDGGYLAALRAKIQSNVVYAGTKQDIEARFRVTQLPTGEVISVRKIKSSGNPAYDTAVENAINKSSPLPKKKDGTVEKELELVFNMKDLP
jgi:colicin import membrane protein